MPTSPLEEALDLLEHNAALLTATVGEYCYGSKARAVARPSDSDYTLAGYRLLEAAEKSGLVVRIERPIGCIRWRLSECTRKKRRNKD